MRFLLVLLPLLGGCATRQVEPGQEFRLSPGERVLLGDTELLIIFERVVEDSRCPMNARCVAAGNARLALVVRSEARDARGNVFEVLDQDVVLDTDPSLPVRTSFFGDFTLELRQLEPTPMAGEPVRRYVAVLYVEAPK